MIKMNLYIKIAEINITKKQLSEITGISKNTIGAYCNGSYKKIDKEHLDKFCKFFKCNVSELLSYYDDEFNAFPNDNRLYDENAYDIQHSRELEKARLKYYLNEQKHAYSTYEKVFIASQLKAMQNSDNNGNTHQDKIYIDKELQSINYESYKKEYYRLTRGLSLNESKLLKLQSDLFREYCDKLLSEVYTRLVDKGFDKTLVKSIISEKIKNETGFNIDLK